MTLLLAFLSMGGVQKSSWPFSRPHSFMDVERSFLDNLWVLWQPREKSFNFLFLMLCKGEESTHCLQPICASAGIILHLKALQALCPAASWLRFFNLIAFVPSFTMDVLMPPFLTAFQRCLQIYWAGSEGQREGGGTQMGSLRIRISIGIIDFFHFVGEKRRFFQILFPFSFLCPC